VYSPTPGNFLISLIVLGNFELYCLTSILAEAKRFLARLYT